MQLALKALRAPKPKSAIKSDSLVRRKLAFASTIEYSACKGYTCVKELEKKSETQVVPFESAQSSTSSQVNIPFGTLAPLTSIQPCTEALSDKGKSLMRKTQIFMSLVLHKKVFLEMILDLHQTTIVQIILDLMKWLMILLSSFGNVQNVWRWTVKWKIV
jgi:hypothetical protein